MRSTTIKTVNTDKQILRINTKSDCVYISITDQNNKEVLVNIHALTSVVFITAWTPDTVNKIDISTPTSDFNKLHVSTQGVNRGSTV